MSNRANIFLSMKKWEEAERDAETAIGIDPKNAKVIYIVIPAVGRRWQMWEARSLKN